MIFRVLFFSFFLFLFVPPSLLLRMFNLVVGKRRLFMTRRFGVIRTTLRLFRHVSKPRLRILLCRTGRRRRRRRLRLSLELLRHRSHHRRKVPGSRRRRRRRIHIHHRCRVIPHLRYKKWVSEVVIRPRHLTAVRGRVRVRRRIRRRRSHQVDIIIRPGGGGSSIVRVRSGHHHHRHRIREMIVSAV